MQSNIVVVMGALALAEGCTYILDIQKDYTVGADAGSSTLTASDEGSAGRGAGGAVTGEGGGGGSIACPAGPGPAMLSMGAFCIDATEVTNGAYAAWLATKPSPADQPEACSFNGSFVPKNGWPTPAADLDKPVAYVNWCDAHAYCASAGKRLCGRVGGGALGFDAFADANESEWMAACSNGGDTDYPYGDAYDPSMCNGKDAPASQTVTVGTEGECHGTHAGLFDMSGNVAEWEDACSGESGPDDFCRRRGGSFKDTSSDLRCAADSDTTLRSWTGSGTGFRCCAL